MSEQGQLSPAEAEAWVKEFGNRASRLGKSRLVHIDCASEDHGLCVAPLCECECHERIVEAIRAHVEKLIAKMESADWHFDNEVQSVLIDGARERFVEIVKDTPIGDGE